MITITVCSTKAQSGKSVIGALIKETLAKHGFTSVQVYDVVQDPVYVEGSEKRLNIIQENKPELFNTDISIVEVHRGNEVPAPNPAP